MFEPNVWGKDHPGIHDLTNKAIMACGMDVRKQMCRSIYLSGGGSMLPGIYPSLVCICYWQSRLISKYFRIALIIPLQNKLPLSGPSLPDAKFNDSSNNPMKKDMLLKIAKLKLWIIHNFYRKRIFKTSIRFTQCC
jgi:hypothetical protein